MRKTCSDELSRPVLQTQTLGQFKEAARLLAAKLSETYTVKSRF